MSTAPSRNGAGALVSQLALSGLRHVFANPGTTEMPLVEALDNEPAVSATLGLQENVCTAAADGYWRISGEPAGVLLHLGPGLTNAAANLHNARRARSGAVVIIGDHPDRHLASDSPLQTPLETLASATSDWWARASDPDAVPALGGAAFNSAAAGRISTLIVPADAQVAACEVPLRQGQLALERPYRSPASALDALRAAKRPCLIVGGRALTQSGLLAAEQIAAAHGATLYCETFFAVMERGFGRPAPRRLPYFPEDALKVLGEHDLVVLAGALEPVAFFAYPGMPSRLLSNRSVLQILAGPEDAIDDILKDAAQASAPSSTFDPMPTIGASWEGSLKASTLCAAVAAALPEDSILVDEGITTSLPFYDLSVGARPFRHLTLTGGAIGWGPGAALGASIASPNQTVINVQADGAGLYLPQALWSQARASAHVITVLCSNRTYRILGAELARAGVSVPGPKASAMCDLAGIEWTSIARGFGVPAVRVETGEALAAEMARAIAADGPSFIEAVLP